MPIILSGEQELMMLFRGFPNSVKKKILTHALKTGAEMILQSARNAAPERSGALRAGMNVQKLKRKRGRWGFVTMTPTREELAKGQPTAEKAQDVYGGAGYYPAVIEFGSSKYSPHPYLRPALEMNENQILAMAAQDIREAINGKPSESEDDGDDGSGIDPDQDVAPDAPTHTGKRGGKYKLSRTGKKVYLRR